MSYCRWSTDDFTCDLYVYEDVSGGWTTHVAGLRVVWDARRPAPLEVDWREDMGAWFERNRVVMALLDDISRVPIGLPADGETFNDPTPGACADRIEALQAMGYRCPDEVVALLREEQADLDRGEVRE